jgi:hypothetical protein
VKGACLFTVQKKKATGSIKDNSPNKKKLHFMSLSSVIANLFALKLVALLYLQIKEKNRSGTC